MAPFMKIIEREKSTPRLSPSFTNDSAVGPKRRFPMARPDVHASEIHLIDAHNFPDRLLLPDNALAEVCLKLLRIRVLSCWDQVEHGCGSFSCPTSACPRSQLPYRNFTAIEMEPIVRAAGAEHKNGASGILSVERWY